MSTPPVHRAQRRIRYKVLEAFHRKPNVNSEALNSIKGHLSFNHKDRAGESRLVSYCMVFLHLTVALLLRLRVSAKNGHLAEWL